MFKKNEEIKRLFTEFIFLFASNLVLEFSIN